jgi:hypothetical protein
MSFSSSFTILGVAADRVTRVGLAGCYYTADTLERVQKLATGAVAPERFDR